MYSDIGGLQKAVVEKTQQLSLLNMTLEQQKQAIAILVDLKKSGMAVEEVKKLCMLVGRWNSNGVGLGLGQDQGQGNGSKTVNLELDTHLNLPNQHKEEIN